MLSSEHQNQLCALAENVLGPCKDRTPGSAICNEDNTFTGGTRYECDPCAKHVKEGSCCYSNAYIHQIALNIVSPTPCIKIGKAGLDDGFKLRRDISLVHSPTLLLYLPTEQTLCRQYLTLLLRSSRLQGWLGSGTCLISTGVCWLYRLWGERYNIFLQTSR